MAQPDHIEVDLSPARRNVKRAIRDLEEANRLLAQQEERIAQLEARLAAEFGIDWRDT